MKYWLLILSIGFHCIVTFTKISVIHFDFCNKEKKKYEREKYLKVYIFLKIYNSIRKYEQGSPRSINSWNPEQHVSYFETTLLTIHHLNHRSLVLRNTSVRDSFCLKVNILQNISSDK